MTALVLGGASSGKSGWAEELCLGLGAPRLYLATMAGGEDGESREKIAKHRRARAGKRFTTLERTGGLERVRLERRYGVVLLEDLGNLAAGELFGGGMSAADFPQVAARAVENLSAQCDHLVVVSNQVFSDGGRHGEDTGRWLDALAGANRLLAGRADLVVELVCGIPVFYKGEGEEAVAR